MFKACQRHQTTNTKVPNTLKRTRTPRKECPLHLQPAKKRETNQILAPPTPPPPTGPATRPTPPPRPGLLRLPEPCLARQPRAPGRHRAPPPRQLRGHLAVEGASEPSTLWGKRKGNRNRQLGGLFFRSIIIYLCVFCSFVCVDCFCSVVLFRGACVDLYFSWSMAKLWALAYMIHHSLPNLRLKSKTISPTLSSFCFSDLGPPSQLTCHGLPLLHIERKPVAHMSIRS